MSAAARPSEAGAERQQSTSSSSAGRPMQLEWTDGNQVRLLKNGADFFPALCAAVDRATQSVHLETYIFTLDRTARKVLDTLKAASARGVKVRVVIDGFGSAETVRQVMQELVDAGAQCRIFRPEPKWFKRMFFSRNRLRRLHRKVTVVDGEIAFVGGINIVDDYDDLNPHDDIDACPRFDFAVQVQGPLVTYAVQAQEQLWLRLSRARLRHQIRHARQARRRSHRVMRPSVAGTGPLRAALLLRDNLRYRQTFERAYLYAIALAQREVLIASAYFFPGLRFRRALVRAARRGVRVRLLLQGKAEYLMQYHATHALYAELLRGGVEIYEYMPSYLHAKVAVIDDVASVGSSNLDPFSLLLAREANVVVDDAAFSARLREELEAEIVHGGHQVQQTEHFARPFLRRLLDNVSYTMLRVAVALTGRSGQY